MLSSPLLEGLCKPEENLKLWTLGTGQTPCPPGLLDPSSPLPGMDTGECSQPILEKGQDFCPPEGPRYPPAALSWVPTHLLTPLLPGAGTAGWRE